MAKKGRFIEKPAEVNELIVFGNMVDALLVKFRANVWDDHLKKKMLEVEYRPTDFMYWMEGIYPEDEDNWDSTTGNFKSTYPMDMVGHIEARTEGSWILMLCDYKGEKCDIFEKINKNLWNQNRKLRSDVELLKSQMIGIQVEIREMLKHPQEFMKNYLKIFEKIKTALMPGSYPPETTGVNPPSSGEERHG